MNDECFNGCGEIQMIILTSALALTGQQVQNSAASDWEIFQRQINSERLHVY
jgi:hypothetical protein